MSSLTPFVPGLKIIGSSAIGSPDFRLVPLPLVLLEKILPAKEAPFWGTNGMNQLNRMRTPHFGTSWALTSFWVNSNAVMLAFQNSNPQEASPPP